MDSSHARPVKRVLINAPLAAEDVGRLRAATDVVAVDEGNIAGHIERYVPFAAIVASAVLALDGPMMDCLPGLEVIGRLGTGVDNVDLDAATRRGIIVVHTPEAPTASTAEHTVALLYALSKSIVYQDRGLRAGEWSVRHRYVGRELTGKRMGLVGLGRIGLRVAELLRPLQLRLFVYDPYVDDVAVAAVGAERVHDLHAMLSQVDILSLHAPLTAETRHIIGREELRLMPSEAWLINTSRGGLVDEGALVEALRSGTVGGAALDVFEPEPPAPDNPLLKLDNVIVTPHRAFYTVEGLARLSHSVTDQVLAALRGERPAHVANEEVWAR